MTLICPLLYDRNLEEACHHLPIELPRRVSSAVFFLIFDSVTASINFSSVDISLRRFL
jgi:hypothetical protein